MLLFMPAVVDISMLMRAVADDAIQITKVLSHCVVSVECYRGLVKYEVVGWMSEVSLTLVLTSAL